MNCKTCPQCEPNSCCRKNKISCLQSKREGYPLRNDMCDKNFRYYESNEKRLSDMVARNQYMEDRERRRKLRRDNINSLGNCPRGWFGRDKFCGGPIGYDGLRISQKK